MNSMPEPVIVSVIICCYNQENTISQTIDCVLNQKCNFKYEIIIGEDCSTDNTRNICKEYQNKFPELINLSNYEKNFGAVKNWISCINVAKGKYITTCAGDDYWHNENKLQIQVDYMNMHDKCGVLHTDYDILNPFTNKLQKSVSENKKNKIEGYCQTEIFNGKLDICGPTVCFRKDLFDKYVSTDKYLELKFPIEDWPTWVILSNYATVNFLPISTSTYRKGKRHNSLSNIKEYDKVIDKYKSEKIMYRYVCELFPGKLEYDENQYDIYVNSILLNLAYSKGDFKNAKVFGEKNYNNLRVKCSRNIVLFWMYSFLRKFIVFFKNNR